MFWGKTFEKHDEYLKAMLGRARESNLKHKLEKCHFRKKGVVLDISSHTKVLSQIEAIVNMPKPEGKKGIQRLLGMVNYVGKFVPTISEITSPLRQLLKKDTQSGTGPREILVLLKR